MEVKTFVNTTLESNTYLVEDRAHTNELIIIDPGDNADTIPYIKNHLLQPRLIILTHEHYDHIAGVNQLKSLFPEVVLLCSEKAATRITDEKLNLSFYRGAGYKSVKPDRTVIREKELFEQNTFHIECIPWEGHSPGGMLVVINGVIFCGDQFLKEHKTVTNLPGSKKEQVKTCFTFLKENYPVKMMLYPGHGASFALEELQLL